MKNIPIRVLLFLCSVIIAVVSAPIALAETQSVSSAPAFKLTEYLGEDWSGERVSFPATIPAGLDLKNLAVRNQDGKVLPAQFLSNGTDDRKGEVFFIVDLPAKSTQTWTLISGNAGTNTDLFVKETSGATGTVEFGTSRIAVRCPLGAASFEAGKPAADVSAPIKSVKLSDGTWAGSGKLFSPLSVKSFRGEILASGPVFVRIRLTYQFDRGREYTALLEAIAGQPVVLVTEKYNLNRIGSFLESTRPSNAPQGNYTINAYDKRLYTNGSYWSLSLAEGLSPDRIALANGTTELWGKSTAQGEPPATFVLDSKPGPIVTLNPSHGEWWMNCGQWAGAYSTQGQGFLAFMTLRAGSWVDPHQNVIVMENDNSGQLRGVLPINNGSRTWGLFSCGNKEAVEVQGKEPDAMKYPGIRYPRPAHLATIKYGLLPLDVVKDWTFEFADPRGTVFPHIFAKADELPQLRKDIAENPEMKNLINRLTNQWDSYRKQKDPNYPLYEDRIMNPRGLDNLYLATGDESYAKDLVALLLDRMHFYIHQTKAGVGLTGYRWSHGYGMFHLTTGDLPLFVREADIALGSPSVTPQEKKDIRALLAFFGELFASPDYFSTNYNNGNTDMVTSYNEALGKIASVINGHPKAKEWAQTSINGMTNALNNKWNIPSNEQDEWYAMLTMEMMTQTAICLKRADLDDLFKDQRYRDGLDYFGKLLVPPDPRYGGGFVVPFGNGQAQWLRSAIWAVAASAIKQDDPEFASRLMWYWERAGKPGTFRYGDMEPGGWASLGWIDPTIPAKNPEFDSQLLANWGVLLRNGTGTPQETFLAMQLGKRDGLNMQFNAEGGMVLYAYGVPLVLNSGLRSYDQIVHNGFPNFTAQRFLANRPSFDFRNERETTPKTGKLLEWSTNSRGDLASGEWNFKRLVAMPNPGPTSGKDAFELSKPRPQLPGLEYGFSDVETVPNITWRRHIMFIKDPDPAGPNYFVIRDTTDTSVVWDWTISSLANDLKITGNAGSFTGKFGVDLDLVPLTPVPELVTGAWGPTDSFAGDWRQKLYQVQLPKSGEMAAVLFPRLHNQPAPVITPWAGISGAKVVLADAVHHVLLADKSLSVNADGVAIDGRAASVIQKGNSATLCLLSGTHIGVGDIELTTDDASTPSGSVILTVDKDAKTVSGETHGHARTISLRLPELFRDRTIYVDGNAVGTRLSASGTVEFDMAQGDHQFVVKQ